MPVFHEVRLPDNVEKGAAGGPGFHTTILELSSGFEQRNIDWSLARAKYNVGYGIQEKVDFDIVKAFFFARRGKAYGFRFKDWTDFEMIRMSIGTGDGVDATWQIQKTYTDAGGSYVRLLTKIVAGTVQVWVNNVLKAETTQYTVNYNTGVITFTGGNIPAGGQNIEALCQFDVPVRFDTDDFSLNAQTATAASIPNLPIIEVRV